MNFLQLCQETNTYCGFQGSITAVTGVTGYQARLIQEVKRAWMDIQRERYNWDFLRKSEDFDTDSSTTEYSLATIFGTADHDFGRWITNSIMYDYEPLKYVDYDYYLTLDRTGSSGEPGYFTIHPQSKNLILDPLDGIYTITAHYFRTPQELTDTADVPLVLSKHHWAIVYKAAMGLAGFVGNPTLYQSAALEYSRAFGELLRDENPGKTIEMRPIV